MRSSLSDSYNSMSSFFIIGSNQSVLSFAHFNQSCNSIVSWLFNDALVSNSFKYSLTILALLWYIALLNNSFVLCKLYEYTQNLKKVDFIKTKINNFKADNIEVISEP